MSNTITLPSPSSRLHLPPKQNFSIAQIDRMVENEHMGLPRNFDEREVHNLLMDSNYGDLFDNPSLEIIDFMSRPENFYYTCKWLLNINLMPFQVTILEELWNRKFPMLIATRGGGKTWILSLYAMLRAIFHQGSKVVVVGAAFRQSKLLFEYMEQFWRAAPILRNMVGGGKHQGPKRDIDRCNFYIGDSEIIAIPLGDGCLCNDAMITTNDSFSYIDTPTKNIWGNGKFRESDEHYDNGIADTKIVETQKGFSFEGTHNHKMRIYRNKQIMWVRTDEMVVGDRILIDRSLRWHNGDFDCSIDEAYILGAMIGDGCWTQKYRMSFATNDKQLSDILINNDEKWYQTDKAHWNKDGIKEKCLWLDFWKLKDKCYAKDKTLPSTILSASQNCMTACLQGLFDTDGHVQIQTAQGGTSICVGFTNTSKELVRQMQYILLHYGIVANVSSRDRNEKWNTVYELLITGQDAVKFGEQIGFRLNRKQEKLQTALTDKKRTTVSGDIIPDVRLDMIRISQENRIPKGKRNPLLDCVTTSKIASRKEITLDFAEKFLEKYSFVDDEFIDNLKVLCIRHKYVYYDKIVSIKDSSSHTYDMHIPDGHEYCANGFFSHNSKIRGIRANYTVADEFASIPLEIFEVVIKGFASVSASPEIRSKDVARINILKSLGMHAEADDIDLGFGNQTIVSGTAYYSFNHFYDYWNRYKQIIETQGDEHRLQEIFRGEVPEGFDWKQFGVFRIPWQKIPAGFMDETQIHQAKATVHSAIYQMEYGAAFARDSDGFFKRSLIESCVCSEPISLPNGPIQFSATIRGNPNCKYVYGIDPASERDNFALVILEVHPDHRRIVYSWTISRQEMVERIKKSGTVKQKSFYTYCARKIRDLMKVFPTEHIAIDTQGGGIAIMEALHDPDEFDPMTEQALWPWIKQGETDVFWWEKSGKPTDVESGNHLLHMVQFAQADFIRDANHGMRKDFESKITLFPKFDPVTVSEAISLDQIHGREYDTLEDCVVEIEELKDELVTIIHTQTTSGRDKWDTPEVKLPGNKKGRLRKDRYSALLIANMIARVMTHELKGVQHEFVGGFAGQKPGPRASDGTMYVGPNHIVSKMNAGAYYGKAVHRK